MSELERFLSGLPGKISRKNITAIMEYVEANPANGVVESVELANARVPVETVSVYGLEIALDASGNAVTVGFPAGAEVIA